MGEIGMSTMVYPTRQMGGNVELHHWKERYGKDLRFNTVEDLCHQARHGIHPRSSRRKHRSSRHASSRFSKTSPHVLSMAHDVRLETDVSGARTHSSALPERPELP